MTRVHFPKHSFLQLVCPAFVLVCAAGLAWSQPQPTDTSALSGAIKAAVDKVNPALVRIHVVETYYDEGREMKSEASGSGIVIRADGTIITNHHVAGHAKHMKCTFSNKEEIEAELVGTDPLTDIALIRLKNTNGRTFPVAAFGDSSAVRVGDHVLAMGSPLALSQSVTLGIVSNAEMTMPDWMDKYGGMEQDGENVGSLVRWLGHDAEIFGGNSGGPLVTLGGEVIGINEIKMGLSGAIPGNLAREVAEAIMAQGQVKRAWLGVEVQPRLKTDGHTTGALIGGVVAGAPADKAGFKAGDHIVELAGTPVDVKFSVQLPDFNRLTAGLAVGQPVTAKVDRGGTVIELSIIPAEREPVQLKQFEQPQWGLTFRDLSFMMAREMKRDSTDGVLVTSVRPGGSSGEAKPALEAQDVIVEVGGKPVRSVRDLMAATEEITKGKEEPVSTLVTFERKTERYVTVVRVGLKELIDPGLEAKKAWLPIETQVITRDLAEQMGAAGLTGFRVTHVYRDSTAAKAGLQVGDLILSVDGTKLTANRPEDGEDLATFIRQYGVGAKAELLVRRGAEEQKLSVELIRAPKLAREMKRFRDDVFEFTVRDITMFDIASERWRDDQQGVLVEQVRPGGWASLGQLQNGDLLLEINGAAVTDVTAAKDTMGKVAESMSDSVVFRVLRGIHTLYIELEPRWDKKQGG